MVLPSGVTLITMFGNMETAIQYAHQAELGTLFRRSGRCSTKESIPSSDVYCCYLLLLFVTTTNFDC
jgi:hypothetical protein